MLITVIVLSILVGIWSITGMMAAMLPTREWGKIFESILVGPLAWVVGIIIAIFGFIYIIGRCFIFGFKKEWPW